MGGSTAGLDLLAPLGGGYARSKSEVAYVRIGPVGMMFLPGEVAGELAIGLPADWPDRPGDWFAGDPARHAVGADYETPGYVLDRMPNIRDRL